MAAPTSSHQPDEGTLASLLEASPAATLTLDREGRVRFANGLSRSLFGATPVGAKLAELIPDLAAAEPAKRLASLLEASTTETARFEVTFSRPDGRLAPLEIRARRWVEGGVHAGIVRFVEGTEVAPSQVELHRLLELHQRVLEATNAAVYVVSPEGVFERVNRSGCEITGYRESEIVGRHFALVLRPEDEAGSNEAFAKALSGEPVFGFESDILRSNGEVCRLLVNLQPRFEGGRVTGVVGVGEDVTERRRIERARDELSRLLDLSNRSLAQGQAVGIRATSGLPVVGYLVEAMMGRTGREDDPTAKALEARLAEDDPLRDVLDVASVMICVKDRKGRHLLVNRHFEHLTGLRREQVKGKLDHELYPKDVADQVRANDEAVLASEQPDEFEESYRTDDGMRTFMAVRFPLRNQGGEVAGVCAIGTEITERKQMEEALRDQAEKLARADQRKDEFLAILGHELRNPLAAIRSAVDLANRSLPERAERTPNLPTVQRALATVDRQMDHLVSLVDDLLDVGRITAGRVSLRRELVDVASIVANASETVAPMAEARRQTVAVTAPHVSVWVDGDPLRLTQVLVNLLSNAVRYSAEGSRIELVAKLDGDRIALTVRDPGAGISPEVLPHLFEPFHRGDRDAEPVHEGLGIGLSLVRSLTEMHGGTVTARSRGLGKGSEFCVRLPVAKPPEVRASEAAPEPPSVDAPDAGSLRILVADDNHDAAEGLAELLRLSGHEVETVGDGRSALDRAVVGDLDVAILDIGMPGLDGYEVARRVRASGTGPRALVALTGYAHDAAKARVREAGFDVHLVKPVDPARLEDTLKRV